MENILKVFLMAFPEWLACIFMVVGLVVTALAAVRLGYEMCIRDRHRSAARKHQTLRRHGSWLCCRCYERSADADDR